MEKTRKELKEEYKQKKFPMGVFSITNISNGKVYIGSSTNLDLIWNSDKFKLDMGGHKNPGLQEDWKKYGQENFSFEILHELEPSNDPAVDMRSELKALEELTIDELQPFGEKGYHKKKIIRT
jgi:group I intron endonuclease